MEISIEYRLEGQFSNKIDKCDYSGSVERKNKRIAERITSRITCDRMKWSVTIGVFCGKNGSIKWKMEIL